MTSIKVDYQPSNWRAVWIFPTQFNKLWKTTQILWWEHYDGKV